MIVVWAVGAAAAGTWVREPGHGYVQLAGAYTVAVSRFTEEGRRLPMVDPHFVPENFEQVFASGRTTQIEASVYAELGVVPGLELVGQLPLRRVVADWAFAQGGETVQLANLALGDAVVGARYGRLVPRGTVSAAVLLRAPLYDNAPERLGIEAGNTDLYDDRPPVGAGAVELDLVVAGGTSGSAGWAQAELGLRLRDRQLGAQLPARVQAGARFGRAFACFAELEALVTVADGKAPNEYLDAFTKGPIALDRAAWLRPAIGLLIEPFSSAEATRSGMPGLIVRAGTILLGRRTSATTTITAGGTYRW